jgi:hypothetical protein
MKNSVSIGDTLRTVAISANLSALSTILSNAAALSAEAHGLSLRGERNAAIGTVLSLTSMLEDAKALHAAAIALHSAKGL